MDGIAAVTGASSGIGRALAKALAAEGYRVGLIARRQRLLDELLGEIRANGGVAVAATADVSDRIAVQGAIQTVEHELGPIDLLIANAGVGVPTLVEPLNIEAVEETFRVNVMGVIYAVEAVLPSMLARGSGHLVAVSSLAGDRGLPGESAYCASKAAVNAFMEGLRLQIRERGVRVTTVCPGFVRTPMTAINDFDMMFVMEAEEAAARIVRGLRKRRKVIRFPWQMSLLMRLTRLAPDALLARLFRDYNAHPPMPEFHRGAGSD